MNQQRINELSMQLNSHVWTDIERAFLQLPKKNDLFFLSLSVGTPIQQFYSKKSVFMTGASGFLGKSE